MRNSTAAWWRGAATGIKPALVVALVLPLLLFPGAFLGGRVVSADDHLYVHQAWARPDAPPLRHPHLSDPALQLEPLRDRALAELRAGRAPLWNPDIFAGAPLLADAQSAPASPTTLLRLLLPEAVAQDLGVAWLLAWTALGTALLALRLGAGPWGAAAAAAGAGTGPFLGAWLLHPHAASYTWLPWVLWGLERGHPAGLALCVLGLVAGGHPGTVGHVLVLAALWWLLRRRDLAGPLGAATGLLLAAPLWLPFAELLQRSVTLEARRGSTLLPRQLLDLAWPGLLGHPARESWQGPGAWIDGQLHPGLLVLPLALPALGTAVGRWLWLLWLAAVAGSVLGVPGPGNHARLGSEAAVLLAVAAGLGASRLLGEARRMGEGSVARAPPRRIVGGALVGLVLLTGAWARRDDQGTVAVEHHAAAPDDWVVALRGALGCDRPEEGRCQRVLGLQHALQPNLASRAGLRDLRGYDLPVGLDTQRFMAALDSRLERPWFRVQALPPARLLDLAGVGALLSPEPLSAVRADLVPWDPQPGVYLRPSAGPRAWLSTAPQLATEPRAALAQALREADPWTRVPVEGLAAAGPAAGRALPVEVQEVGGSEVRLQVDAPAAGVVVLADAWAPGWLAEVDGASAPVLRAAGLFRAVEVTAGRHEVRMRYRPAGWTWGLRLGGAGVVLLGGLLVAGRRRRPGSP